MTLQEAVNRSKSEHGIFPDIIFSDAGLFEVPELNVVGMPSWNRNRKRKVVLEITSYKGISSDAVHFYGKILVEGVYTATLNDIETSRNISYEDENKYPLLKYKYKFLIKRPLTKKEIESNKDRWYSYSEGDLVQGFETTDELIKDTIEILKLRFIGDWDYIVQYPRGNKEKLIITN